MQEQSENKPLIFACGRKFAEIHPAKRSGASGALVPLLYDSLIELDNSYHINRNYKDHLDGGLASEIEQDGLTYTITLHDAVFSDGSEVRAADVANSLAAAMEEARGILESDPTLSHPEHAALRQAAESALRDTANTMN